MYFFLGICFALQIFFISQMFRVNMIFRVRSKYLNAVSAAAQEDIKSGRLDDWQWRYDAFSAVSFDEMVWKFWRRPSSFYKDHSFMQIEGIAPNHDHAR